MGDTQGSGDLRQGNPLNMDELVAAFLAGLQSDLRAAYVQRLGQEGQAGSVGGTVNRRRRKAQPEVISVHAVKAFYSGAGLHAHAQQNTSGRRGEYWRGGNRCHAADPLFQTPSELLRAFGGAAHGCHHQPPQATVFQRLHAGDGGAGG